MVMALELREFDASMTTGKRFQGMLALIERHLEGPAPARLNEHGEHRLLMVGRRVIRMVPFEAGVSTPFWECLSVVHLQSELVRHGALLRGALTFGDAAERAAVVTGPGIFEAERLCDEVADKPRVMVDPRLFREVEANKHLHWHTAPMEELGYIRSLLREDADGVWFVDYLKAFKTEVSEPSLYLDLLEEHRQLVERQLRQADTLNRHSRSWTWLRSYHNQVIEELYEQKVLDSAERERLRLTAQGSLVYVFPPSAKIPR
jgi:hypothetical protein